MKAVFIGGGSHRLLGILRGAMAREGVLDDGEINLYDLNKSRSRAMGRMLRKTPEHARCGCRITWGTSLARALDGADLVAVILKHGSLESWEFGHVVSLKHGFLSSDNLTPNGALLAVKGASMMSDLARKMERYCPDAWLADFANPIAVFSGMVNHHTRIRCLGLCAGFKNHTSDLCRLQGRDESDPDTHVRMAGINHLSFITGGTFAGRDPFEIIRDAAADPDFKYPRLDPSYPAHARESIRRSIDHLVELWRDFGVLLFSTEPDGTAHLYPDRTVKAWRKHRWPTTKAEARRRVRDFNTAREVEDHEFQELADSDLDPHFWETRPKTDRRFLKLDDDIFIRVLEGVAGHTATRLVTSRPNEGAIEGIPDRTVVEYVQRLQGRRIEPAEPPQRIPPQVEGIVQSLASYQTQLADALATNDPKMLAHALLAYPAEPYSDRTKALFRELIDLNAEQMPKPLLATREELR